MKRLAALATILAVSAMLSSGCALIEDLLGGSKPVARPSPTPPKPTPAIDFWDAKRTVGTWTTAYNQAAEKYDLKAVARIETGALREAHRAEFKIAKRNDVHLRQLHQTSDLTIPRFLAWPKWFTARIVSTGSERVDGQAVFVQEKRGGRWRAASLAWLSGALDKGAYPPPDATVMEPSDPTPVIAPGRLPAVHAHAIRYGAKSPHAKLFASPAEIGDEHKQLMKDHRYFRKQGWSGRARVSASKHPVYVLRTGSGGALVFYSVDMKAAYKQVRGEVAISHRSSDLGQLLPAFIGAEYAASRLIRVERTDYATYIPPGGKGEIQVLASRWAPVSVVGS